MLIAIVLTATVFYRLFNHHVGRAPEARRGGVMKTPKHHAEGKSVLVGRVEVARFTDEYQARRFVEFIEEKHKDIPTIHEQIEEG